jgi:glycosyltransferase involved in cell wall biosynthesis
LQCTGDAWKVDHLFMVTKTIPEKSIIVGIPVLLVGGTEMQTLNLVKALISAGYQVIASCYYEYDEKMVKRFEAAGAEVLLMKYERAKGLWHLAKGLITLFKQHAPDVVHVQYVAPGFVPIVAARLAGVKTIFATVHQPGRTYGWKPKFLLRSAARLCTAFFCNSRSVEESWFGDSALFEQKSAISSRKHWTIYNAVDTDQISQVVAETDRQALRTSIGLGNGPVLGCVARLRWEKGQAVLLEAMADVIKRVPEAMLIMVGDGPDRMNLELRAKSLGLASNILWLGQKSPEEVYQLYGIMDVVAVPSLFEGFGLSAAEAMAAGRPVVASSVDGLNEIVEQGVTGYLAPANDQSALAVRLTALLCNPASARSMGIQGQKRVKKYFSSDAFANAICAAYKHYLRST